MKYLLTLLYLTYSFSVKNAMIETRLSEDQLNNMERRGRILILEKRIKSEPFSRELFYEALKIHCDYPEILYQQAVLETGWFTSKSFVKYNNPFGMKKPVKRKTFCKKSALGHGHYDNWYDAVKDMSLWQKYWRGMGYDYSEDYYLFLKDVGYAEDVDYAKKLKGIPVVINKYFI